MENIQDKNIEILFEPIKHEYTVNGEKAKISVTGIVEKQVTGNEYFSVPPDVLQRAADRGTEIHADLEYFVGKGTAPKTKACQNFANYIKANGWTIESPLCEFKMAIRWTAQNDKKIQSFILSGTADLLCKLNGKWVVIDHKTTSSVHEESVRWQMSLLDFMARQLNGCIINGVLFDYIPAEELYVFHFDKSDVFKPIKVDRISDVEIMRMLDAEALDEEYHPTPVEILTPRQQDSLMELQKKLYSLKLAKKRLDDEEAQLRAQMEAAFAAHPDTKKVELEHMSITYTAPTTVEGFDKEKFKSENPELYKKYVTTSARKGSVTITLSKELQAQLELSSPDVAIAQPKLTGRKNTKRGFFS